jgi:hypothetical protein
MGGVQLAFNSEGNLWIIAQLVSQNIFVSYAGTQFVVSAPDVLSYVKGKISLSAGFRAALIGLLEVALSGNSEFTYELRRNEYAKKSGIGKHAIL